MDSIWVRSLKQGGGHSYHRRAINHDYYAPFIYHIILKKTKDCESFGTKLTRSVCERMNELAKTIARL